MASRNAKSRMIHWKISYCKQLSRCSLVANLLFTWLIPNTDDLGRIEGDPEVIKGMMFPYHDNITNLDIKNALGELFEEKLINWYKVEENLYIELPNFRLYQKLRKDRTYESDYPSPNSVMTSHDKSCHVGQKVREGEEKRRRREGEEKISEGEGEGEEKQEISSAESEAINTFEQNIHMISPIEFEKLMHWMEDVEPSVVIGAIEEAVNYNKRSMGYINAVLNNWLKIGITTRGALDSFKRDKADEKNKSNNNGSTMHPNVKQALDLVKKYEDMEREQGDDS